MVSDFDIIKCIHSFLKESDLSIITNSILREKLELAFGVSFSDRKDFIREQADLFIKEELECTEATVVDDDVQVKRDEDCGGVSLEKPQSSEKAGFGSEATDYVKAEVEEEEEGKEANDITDTAEDITRPEQVDEKGKKTPSGFHKLCSLSPPLQEFTGSPELPRTKVVKKLWEYIKENDLQEPTNRRNIICDEKLRSIFGVSSIDMFKMSTALKTHIWPLGSDCAVSTTSSWKQEQRRRKRERNRMKGEESPKKKKKKRKKVKEDGSEHPLSDALVNFLGAEGEPKMAKSMVMTKIWEYIKMNHLQDPSNREVVKSDSKLKELFQVDSFKDNYVPTLLSHHFLKDEE